LVKFVEIKKYVCKNDYIYTITPDFETIQYIEPPELGEDYSFSEEYHLEGVDQIVKDIYSKVKEITLGIDSKSKFNPQKYYISIKAPKNIAYLELKNKKVRFTAMMPEKQIRNSIKNYIVLPLSQGVQDFYGRPCAAVFIDNLSHEDEIVNLISSLIAYNQDSGKVISE